MQSAYAPRQGDQFLMFANWHNNHPAQTYTATEKYRIVPLSRHFQTNDLVGQPLGEQIQRVLRHRLQELHRELQQGAVEKKRLEEGIKP